MATKKRTWQTTAEKSPKTIAARDRVNRKFNAKPENATKKNEATSYRKKNIKKGSRMDASHQPDGSMKAEDRHANRSRGGKAGSRARKAAGGRKSSRKGIPNRK